MNGDEADRLPSRPLWHRVGMLALVVIMTAAVVTLGLVLTGIIAEPETVMLTVGRWILGR